MNEKGPQKIKKIALEVVKSENPLTIQKVELDVVNIKQISDGHHTFADLYEQRLVLSAALFNAHCDKAGKSKRHFDEEGPCFGGGYFLAWVETPDGNFSYHYKIKYWDMFKVPEHERGPEWDGHGPADVWRLMSL